jgi:hypothetical protein
MYRPQTMKAAALTAGSVVLALVACAAIIVNSSSQVDSVTSFEFGKESPWVYKQEMELDESAAQSFPGGLKVVDVSAGDGPEPQIGEKIKVLRSIDNRNPWRT